MALITSLRHRRFRSTKEMNEQLKSLSSLTGWRDDTLSRLAIFRSLREPSAPPLVEDVKAGGKELRAETLFREQEEQTPGLSKFWMLPFVTALAVQHSGQAMKSEEDAYKLLTAHWARGLTLLQGDLEAASRNVGVFLQKLARDSLPALASAQNGTPQTTASVYPRSIRPLTVPIGRAKAGAEPFTVTFNDFRSHSNCHMAISGKSGSGKTQLAMQVAASLARAGGDVPGLIFLDYAKGDVADNHDFVRSINAEVFRPQDSPLPIAPFWLPEYSDSTTQLAAEDKREVYSQLFKLGPKQQGRLAKAIKESYESLRSAQNKVPDFATVDSVIDRIYRDDGLAPDTLTEVFRRINALPLLWRRDNPSPPVLPVHKQRWVVDIHELGGLKEVVAFTIIEQLYREMRELPDSAIDNDTNLREIRCVLFIDEAQNYLNKRNKFLQGLIREGRSKGFAIVLLCQSPDDFDQNDFDYTEQIEFTYMLACKTNAKSVSRLLGTTSSESKRLADALGSMETLRGIGRIDKGPCQQFSVVPLYELLDSGD